MSQIKRFGISLDGDLLKKFDKYIKRENYHNRSEAIRDLLRKELIEYEWEKGKDIVGVISMVYDHHMRDIVNKIIDIQHKFPNIVKASQHIHIDHHNCLEVVIAEGLSDHIKQLASQLKALRGVKHCVFTPTTTGKWIT